LHHRQYE